MQEGSGVTNLQTELNYLDSFKSYCNSSDLGFLGSGGWGVSGVISCSLYEFRNVQGKESSNRIKLSRLVQDLLNFGVLGSLQLWGSVDGGWVVGGCPPHMCTCTHTHTHTCMVNMIISCKWPPPFGEYLGIPYDVICVCLHVCVCAHGWGAPSHHPPPPGGPPKSFKIQ